MKRRLRDTSVKGPFVGNLLDPPWPEHGGGKIKRGADRWYKLLSKLEDFYSSVVDTPVWMPADNSHLYLWVTNTYLPLGLELMEALGFKYKTNLPWTKTHMGLGQYFRGCHELLLFGVRGDGYAACTVDGAAKRVTVRGDFLVGADRPRDKGKAGKVGKRIHSAKPDSTYQLVERRTRGPYLEMFARPRPGLQVGGNWLRYGMPEGADRPCILQG